MGPWSAERDVFFISPEDVRVDDPGAMRLLVLHVLYYSPVFFQAPCLQLKKKKNLIQVDPRGHTFDTHTKPRVPICLHGLQVHYIGLCWDFLHTSQCEVSVTTACYKSSPCTESWWRFSCLRKDSLQSSRNKIFRNPRQGAMSYSINSGQFTLQTGWGLAKGRLLVNCFV